MKLKMIHGNKANGHVNNHSLEETGVLVKAHELLPDLRSRRFGALSEKKEMLRKNDFVNAKFSA